MKGRYEDEQDPLPTAEYGQRLSYASNLASDGSEQRLFAVIRHFLASGRAAPTLGAAVRS